MQHKRTGSSDTPPLAAGRGLVNACLFGLGLWMIALGLLLLLPEALYAIAGLLASLVTMVMLRSVTLRRPLTANRVPARSLQR